MTPKSIAQFVQWFWLASKLPQEPKDGQHHFQGSFVDPLTPEVHDDKYSNALQDIQWAGAVIPGFGAAAPFSGIVCRPLFIRPKTWKKPYEVHLEVTRLERHAIFRRSLSLDNVDCFDTPKTYTYQ